MVPRRPVPFSSLADPFATLRDSVGRCPLLPCVPFALATDTDGALDNANGGAFNCASEERRLCALETLIDCPLLYASPLPRACGRSVPAGRAMFLNVMMHSTCSPAYMAGSFHCTYARIFDGADGVGGIVNNATAQLP